MANKFKKPNNPVAAFFSFPTDVRALMRMPKNIVVPAEIIMAMGHVASVVYYYRNNKNSRYHKTAMLVDCVSYDYIDKNRPVVKDGWISVNYKNSRTKTSYKASFRNVIRRHFRWDNKTYDWSGLIMNSKIAGCDSRFSIGVRSKLYGLGAGTVFSLGLNYKVSIIAKF